MGESGATILVVDDDDDVREFAIVVFEEDGFAVVSAPGGEEALGILRSDPAIALLFTDISMPGMDGFELAHEAKQLRPDLRVIYTSGFVKGGHATGGHGNGYGPFVTKPWKVETLRSLVRSVIPRRVAYSR
jgi:CheY-like chemotaxis protein